MEKYAYGYITACPEPNYPYALDEPFVYEREVPMLNDEYAIRVLRV